MRKERKKRKKGARGPRYTIHPDTNVTLEDASTVVINEQSAQGGER